MKDRDAKKEMNETSSSLLARAKSHDQEAWSSLVSLYAPIVYSWCRRWGAEPQVATQIGKTVLEHVFHKLRDVEANLNKESFREWLFKLTRREYVNQVHAQHLSGDEELNPDEETALFRDLEQMEQNLNVEQQLLYQRAFDLVRKSYSPQDWGAFSELYLKQRPATEIAIELEISVDAVYVAKSKILRRLRLEFNDLLEF